MKATVPIAFPTDSIPRPSVMSPFPAEIYHHILAQLPPTRDSDSSVHTLLNCSEVNSLLRCVSISATLWRPHYQIRYKHSDERKEEERRSKTSSNWRALYVERRRLESQALKTMKNIILGNTESLYPAAEEEGGEHEHMVSWLQVVGRSTVQLGMDIYDMLDILQRTAPRRILGAPVEEELACEHPTSPWKSWAEYLKGLVLRHDTVSRWIRMKDRSEEVNFERTLAGMSAFYGVSYVEVGGTASSSLVVLNSVVPDIRRFGFAGRGMQSRLRVFWCSNTGKPRRSAP